MNNITQVKRGSTASWSLGPELVHWENLDVQGKDSLIHCEGTELEMFTRTSSANYFYDENGQLEKTKRPGLWLIQKDEIPTDPTKQYKIKLKTVGPPDCWLEVIDDSGALLGQKIYLGGAGRTDEITVSNFSNFGLYIRWEKEESAQMSAQIKLSIREVNAYEELAPGQLGVEYTEDGKTKLKVGMPNASKWNELPYIGSENTVDWDIADESNPAAIKNKPFGMVEQMIDIIPEGEYNFERPHEMATDIVYIYAPKFDDLFYNVWFNDAYLGTVRPEEKIEIPNGQFYFTSGAMVITGGNYPEGKYKVRIAEKQVITKKLDSQWLNTQSNIYTVGADNDPASCRGVISAIGEFGNAVGSFSEILNRQVIPAIGSVPTDNDNGKVLQVVGGKPTWASSAAIIDVIELPENDINENAFYRLLTATFIENGVSVGHYSCAIVETLPDVGEPVTTDMTNINAYYSIANSDVYGYINDTLSEAVGAVRGWHTLDDLSNTFKVRWGGIIYHKQDATDASSIYLLLDSTIYTYNNINWKPLKPNILTVTWAFPREDNRATHNFSDIAACVKDGYRVIFIDDNGAMYNLAGLDNHQLCAIFVCVSGTGYISRLQIFDDAHVYIDSDIGVYSIGIIDNLADVGAWLCCDGAVDYISPGTNINLKVPYLHFYGTHGDEPVRLGGVIPGENISDVVTVGQLNDSINDLITTDDIDAICGATMNMATLENEVTF